jgi:hypothetical protein
MLWLLCFALANVLIETGERGSVQSSTLQEALEKIPQNGQTRISFSGKQVIKNVDLDITGG